MLLCWTREAEYSCSLLLPNLDRGYYSSSEFNSKLDGAFLKLVFLTRLIRPRKNGIFAFSYNYPEHAE